MAIKHDTNVVAVEPVTLLCIRSRIGQGIAGDPERTIVEYYTTQGEFLFRRDGFRDVPKAPDNKELILQKDGTA